VRCLLAIGVLNAAMWPCLAAAVPQSSVPASSAVRNPVLRVGVAGSEPFVVKRAGSFEGISVEIWQAIAGQTGWRYKFQPYESVPQALDALSSGALEIVVGPVSITAGRVRSARFSQPYYQSSLSILSRGEGLTLWQRVAPFFNTAFYYAVGVLLLVLTAVGTLVWLAERRAPGTQFPRQPGRGIANGMWFAIVTMSTVGYGDLAPRTRLGRVVTGLWIIISVITASSLVAGIASTLTLTSLQRTVVSTAEQLTGKPVAVLANSPGEDFARRYGARLRQVESLPSGYDLLAQQAVDAVVFDRPQLLYFLQQHHRSHLAVSVAQYMPQNYGFAMPISSRLVHTVNVHLLQLEQSGRVDRIVRAWLGDNRQ
jgi:polar amino acid transport system substrate-binding protein